MLSSLQFIEPSPLTQDERHAPALIHTRFMTKVSRFVRKNTPETKNIRSVAFLVCTRNRTKLLRECIGAIRKQDPVRDISCHIVIADNNPHGEEDSIRALCPEAHYKHEPSRGYSNIRNAALNCALTNTDADLFIFVDDDVIPQPDLMQNHISTIEACDADVSAGATVGSSLKNSGARTSRISTNNVAFRRWIAEDIRFCPEANLIGHEDHEFFQDALKMGAKMVRAPKAQVANSQLLPPNNNIRLLRRVSARNDIRISLLRHGLTKAVMRYLHLYSPRLYRGVLFHIIHTASKQENHKELAETNLSLHKGAIEGFFLRGLDREKAKQGEAVEVD